MSTEKHSPVRIVVPPSVAPKPGYQTSSFAVFMATLVAGGVFTVLVKRGLASREQADAFRPYVVSFLAEQLLPAVYMAVVGWVGRAFVRQRGEVSKAKAEALGAVVRAQVAGNNR